MTRDAMITPVGTTPIYTAPAAMPPAQPTPGPGKFARIFGGILGGALNFVAPGAGGLIGNFIGGGAGVGGGAGFGDMQAMLAQQQLQSMQMLQVQNRVQSQTQEFTTVSNLLKARHDGEMSAVNNFKS